MFYPYLIAVQYELNEFLIHPKPTPIYEKQRTNANY